jgi:hypothetical protein
VVFIPEKSRTINIKDSALVLMSSVFIIKINGIAIKLDILTRLSRAQKVGLKVVAGCWSFIIL